MKGFGTVLLIILLISLPLGCGVYAYKECKNVGHSTSYCVWMSFK